MLGKHSADDNLKYFSYFFFSEKERTCIKCQRLFSNLYEMSRPISGKNKKNIINYRSVKFAHRVVKVKVLNRLGTYKPLMFRHLNTLPYLY